MYVCVFFLKKHEEIRCSATSLLLALPTPTPEEQLTAISACISFSAQSYPKSGSTGVCVCVCVCVCVHAPVCLVAQSCPLFVTSWTVAHQALLSMGFSRQECWNGLPFPSPGDLPDPGFKPVSPGSSALTDGLLPTEPLGKPRTH